VRGVTLLELLVGVLLVAFVVLAAAALLEAAVDVGTQTAAEAGGGAVQTDLRRVLEGLLDCARGIVGHKASGLTWFWTPACVRADVVAWEGGPGGWRPVFRDDGAEGLVRMMWVLVRAAGSGWVEAETELVSVCRQAAPDGAWTCGAGAPPPGETVVRPVVSGAAPVYALVVAGDFLQASPPDPWRGVLPRSGLAVVPAVCRPDCPPPVYRADKPWAPGWTPLPVAVAAPGVRGMDVLVRTWGTRYMARTTDWAGPYLWDTDLDDDGDGLLERGERGVRRLAPASAVVGLTLLTVEPVYGGGGRTVRVGAGVPCGYPGTETRPGEVCREDSYAWK